MVLGDKEMEKSLSLLSSDKNLLLYMASLIVISSVLLKDQRLRP